MSDPGTYLVACARGARALLLTGCKPDERRRRLDKGRFGWTAAGVWGTSVGDRWIAIDVETAAARDSICAVGMVESVGGNLRPLGHWLLRPPRDEWSSFNTGIHGIRRQDVIDKPTLAQWWPEFLDIVAGDPVVAHNAAFDMNAFKYTLEACGVDVSPFRFACSRVIARDAWPGWWSYSLPVIVEQLKLPAFDHHNPLDDALACGRIVHSALSHHAVDSLDTLVAERRLRWGMVDESRYKPFTNTNTKSTGSIITPTPSAGIVFDEDHPLFGKLVAFTGTLSSMNRARAAQLVVDLGGKFSDNITKKTNYLVTATQDFRALAAGASVSNKRSKAEQLISKGADLELIPEDEFLQLVHSAR
jgi:DNA polymerase-3 subunit epsilon